MHDQSNWHVVNTIDITHLVWILKCCTYEPPRRACACATSADSQTLQASQGSETMSKHPTDRMTACSSTESTMLRFDGHRGADIPVGVSRCQTELESGPRPLAPVRNSRWARFVCHSTRRERRMGLAPLPKTSLWRQFAHWFSPVRSVESGDPSRKWPVDIGQAVARHSKPVMCLSSKSLFFFRTMINNGRCKIWSWLERWHLDGQLHNLRHRNIHRPFHSLPEPRAGKPPSRLR